MRHEHFLKLTGRHYHFLNSTGRHCRSYGAGKEGGFGIEVEMRISRWEKVFKMKSAMFKFRWKKNEALDGSYDVYFQMGE